MYNILMFKQKAVIDYLGDGKFVLVDSKKNKESVLPAKVVYTHYLYCNPDFPFLGAQFTKKAIDEIQNKIEDELVRKEESSAASYASTNAKILR